MRILLLKANREKYSYFQEGSESLALAYLASMLRKHNYEVDIFDAQIEGLANDDIFEHIQVNDYKIIGFTIADPTYIKPTFKLAQKIKSENVNTHMTIGGFEPSFNYKEILTECPSFDSVVLYEGEETLLELVQCVDSNKEWKEIKGIAYKNNGDVKCNGARKLIKNLDDLPFPARDYIPYIKANLKENGFVTIAGSRGCNGSCSFCSIQKFYKDAGGPPCRLRSVKNIVSELEELNSIYNIDEFMIIDDNFTLSGEIGRRRVEEWKEELKNRDLKILLSISDRVDNIKREIYKELYEIGVRQVMVGIESTNKEILKYFNKGITFEDIQSSVNILNDLGIDMTATYINFTPKTTLEILRDTIRCLLSLKVNFLLGILNRLQIYMGTPIAQDMFKKGLVIGKFPDYSYLIPDERVEVVYKISQQCLGLFLNISYEIVRLERLFRIKRFRLEKSNEDIRMLKEGRQYLDTICQNIMEEAAEIFIEILDYAEKNKVIDERIIYDIKNETMRRYDAWHRQILFFLDFSPFFGENDKMIFL